MRRFLLFCICWLGAAAVFGQHVSRLGRFSVDEIQGCVPLTVTIVDANLKTTGQCVSGAACLMDYEGNGNKDTNRFSFTYNTPGTYTLSVLYQSIGSDDITITVTENPDPEFQIWTCISDPLTNKYPVTIKVTDKSHDTYIIDFNSDGTPETTIPSGNNATAQFDYGAAGTYNISVQGKDVAGANNCKILTQSFTPLTTLPPATINTLTAVDANNLGLNVTTQPHILYKLGIAVNNDGTFQNLQDIYETDTTGVGSMLVDDNFYCFRLSAYDACAGVGYPSGTICSQDFDVKFNNGSNDLAWKTSLGSVVNYDIFRNNEEYVQNRPPELSYHDTDYDCKEDYCYRIVVNYPGGAKSKSLEKCGTGVFTTTYPPIINVGSVVRAGVELRWPDLDPTIKVDNFDIFKSVGGRALASYAETTAVPYIDADYDYAGGSCYQVNYGDKCGNKSALGIIACPMALSGTIDDKNAVTLTWNSYRGYNQGVAKYTVNKLTKDLTTIVNFETTDTTFVDYDPADNNQVVIYRITATASEAGLDNILANSISNNITIEKPVRLILPTAFTPNGDGINPTFTISGKFVSKMNLQIFDRWGVLVFSSDKNEAWDGTKGGKAMPESAYVWKAEVEDTAGNVFTEQGTVLLLRPPR